MFNLRYQEKFSVQFIHQRAAAAEHLLVEFTNNNSAANIGFGTLCMQWAGLMYLYLEGVVCRYAGGKTVRIGHVTLLL